MSHETIHEMTNSSDNARETKPRDPYDAPREMKGNESREESSKGSTPQNAAFSLRRMRSTSMSEEKDGML